MTVPPSLVRHYCAKLGLDIAHSHPRPQQEHRTSHSAARHCLECWHTVWPDIELDRAT